MFPYERASFTRKTVVFRLEVGGIKLHTRLVAVDLHDTTTTRMVDAGHEYITLLAASGDAEVVVETWRVRHFVDDVAQSSRYPQVEDGVRH